MNMSYPRDLDEIPTAELEQELLRRRVSQGNNLCDYCGRPPNEPACRFPDRHELPSKWIRSSATLEYRRIDNGQR